MTLADPLSEKHPLHVSLVLALHRERQFLTRTLRSLTEAAVHAHGLGIAVEFVATLDRADAETARVVREFDLSAFARKKILAVDHGSLGLSRNDGIAVADGQYISTGDGDDLISRNFISDMYFSAQARGQDCLLFPEYIFAFGDRYFITHYNELNGLDALLFLTMHPFISRVFAHRAVFEQVKYQDVRLSSGCAYEDWHFNAECVARGIRMCVVKDTILFYRQRDGSLLRQADSLSVKQIPPCTLFKPEVFLQKSRLAIERLEAGPIDLTQTLNPAILDNPLYRAFLYSANHLDPEVNLHSFRPLAFWYNTRDVNLEVGRAYYEICQRIDTLQFSEVFLLPFISNGGAEKYISQLMWALYELAPAQRILAILGQKLAQPNRLDLVPPNAMVIDMDHIAGCLDEAARDLLTWKCIQATAPEARIHLRPSTFVAHFFARYGAALTRHKISYFRFADGHVMEKDGLSLDGGQFSFISTYGAQLSWIISDNDAIIEADCQRLGMWSNLYKCLPAHEEPRVSADQLASSASMAYNKILWASRLDSEKRPDLLPRIARELRRVAPHLSLDVFGTSVLESFDIQSLHGQANLTYHGTFDSFAAITPLGRYDMFVYTSLYDGMPNIVLEAIACGIPVIAPDVGAIHEIIEDGVTGVLLPSCLEPDVMAARYVTAIVQLTGAPVLRKRLAEAALERLRARHGRDSYLRQVQHLFRWTDNER